MIIKLENRPDVETAARMVTWLSRPPVEKVTVSLPGLDQSQRSGLEKELTFLFNDCGCLWATPTFLITFSLLFLSRWHAAGFSWGTMGISFVISACAAFTAKLFALAVSYMRLKTCFRRLGDSGAVREEDQS